MSATSLLYNLLVLLSALLALGLAGLALRRDSSIANRVFALLMLAIAEWSFCYVFANYATDPPIRLFWLAAADIGIAFSGPLWLLFALANTGRLEPLPRLVRLALWLIGALSLAALLANGALAIWSQGAAAVAANADMLHGPLFWLHSSIAYSAILAGIAVVLRTLLSAPSPYRDQARLLLIGALVPLLANVAYLARLLGQANTADLTPIGLAASSLMFSYAMRRHQMLTLSPIARQVVLDSMVDGLLVVDSAGRVIEHNPAAATIAELVGAAVGRPLAEASRNAALGGVLADLFASQRASERVVILPTPVPRYIRLNRTPLHDTAGRRLGVLLMLRDITRQTVAEEALARRAADLATLHRVASAIGATIEPRELLPTIAATTRAALGMSYVAVALVDEATGDLVIAAEQADSDGATLIDTRLPQDAEVFGELRRGEPVVIADPQRDARLAGLAELPALALIPLHTNERLIGALLAASAAPASFDREKVHLSQLIAGYIAAALANAQLFEASQQAVRTKSAILDTISHEFRTPITAILGFTELYQEHVLGPVTDEQHEALAAVHRNAHRLLRLVDDMLALARLEAGKLELALHPVELELCVKEAIAQVEAQLPGQPFHVAVDVPDQFPFVQADAMWLRRTLVHLLAHLLSCGTSRQIAVRAFAAGAPGTTGDYQRPLRLEIHAPGLVLSAADQASIFDAFEHVPNSDSDLTISSISRLGLAIGKRAIDQMHGRLSLRSQPDHGSTFTIELRPAEIAVEHVH